MFSEKIQQLVVEQVDFLNDDIEAKVEAVTAAASKLRTLSLQIDGLSEEDDAFEAVAENTVNLASAFGKFYRQLTDQDRASVKAAFRAVYGNPNAEQEVVIEGIFDATIDFIGAASDLNQAADALWQAEPPTEEEPPVENPEDENPPVEDPGSEG